MISNHIQNSQHYCAESSRRSGHLRTRLLVLFFCYLKPSLQVLVAVLEHPADTAERIEMQEELVGFMVAAGTIDRLASVFSLFDQPMRDAAQAVPPHVLQVNIWERLLDATQRPHCCHIAMQ